MTMRMRRANTETTFQGIPIVIEYAKGDIRTGTDKEGKKWSRKMKGDYGYIREFTPKKGDEEHADIYIGDDPKAENAYIIEQLTDDGEFDEFKIVLATHSENEARDLYLAHYPDGWESHIGEVFPVPVAKLRKYVEERPDASN